VLSSGTASGSKSVRRSFSFSRFEISNQCGPVHIPRLLGLCFVIAATIPQFLQFFIAPSQIDPLSV